LREIPLKNFNVVVELRKMSCGKRRRPTRRVSELVGSELYFLKKAVGILPVEMMPQ
jgi:hypothetical protein